jgi:hypothetical protein
MLAFIIDRHDIPLTPLPAIASSLSTTNDGVKSLLHTLSAGAGDTE